MPCVTPGQFVSFALDGSSGLVPTKTGIVSLRTNNPFCWATASNPCYYEVNKVHVGLQPFDIDTTEGTYHFTDAFASINGPRTWVDTGWGMDVPIGTLVQIGAVVNGPHASGTLVYGESPTSQSLTISVDPLLAVSIIDGTSPFVFTVPEIPQTFTGSVSGLMSGQSPLRKHCARRRRWSRQAVRVSADGHIDLRFRSRQGKQRGADWLGHCRR